MHVLAPTLLEELRSSISFDALGDVFADHDHRRPAGGELDALLDRVRATFGLQGVSADLIREIDVRTGSTAWVADDQGAAEGVNLFVPLTRAGVGAVFDRRFQPTNPSEDHIATAGDCFAGVYHWGFAGFTPSARRSIMTVCAHLLEGPARGVYVFARGLTPDGLAALERLGLEPCFELGDRYFISKPKHPLHSENDGAAWSPWMR